MKFDDLIAEYTKIAKVLSQRWPVKNKNQRVFARTMKIVEELGELSDAILSSMNLQRDEKIQKYDRQHLEDEFADVLGSLILLGIEIDIDLTKVMKRKIAFTHKRLKEEIAE